MSHPGIKFIDVPLNSLSEELLDEVEKQDGVQLVVPSYLNEDVSVTSRYDTLFSTRPKFAVCVYIEGDYEGYGGPPDCGIDWPVIPLPLIYPSPSNTSLPFSFEGEWSASGLTEFIRKLKDFQIPLRNHYGDVVSTCSSWNRTKGEFEAAVIVQNLRYRPCQSLARPLGDDMVTHVLVEGTVAKSIRFAEPH